MRIINGRSVADNIFGLSAAERILGNAGNDIIHGGGGDDQILGGAGADTIFGDAGNDTINGGTENDNIDGGVGNDVITGDAGNDRLAGGDGTDLLSDTSGNNSIYGGNGDDTITGGSGNDTASGDAGNDTLTGGLGTDLLYGGIGNDKVFGGLGNDYLYGGDGNDTFTDVTGNDYFNGGAGYDTVDYSSQKAVQGVNVFLANGFGGHDALGDRYAGIENVIGTGLTDYLWGNNSDNVLNAALGNDFLRGFGGNDLLIGGVGTDVMYGDDGNDTLRIGEGNDIAYGGNGYDWLDFTDTGALNIIFAEQGILGGSFTVSGPYTPFDSIKLTGDQTFFIEGLRGSTHDDILAFEGAPVGTTVYSALDGGAGDDVLSGANRYYGGDGIDRFFLSRFGDLDKASNPYPNRVETVHLQFDKGIDEIAYFNWAGEGDKLEVSRAEFGLKTDALGNTLYNWVNADSPTATTTQKTFIYETTTAIIWFDADGTGTAHAPIAIAKMYTDSVAHQSDLIFVA
jgi:Ca2+-binding RTX toxin-like protein